MMNLFSPPTEKEDGTRNLRPTSVAISSIVGGLVGLVIGIVAVVALFFVIPGVPGIAEILILFVGVVAVLVLPGIVIGAVVGFALNSRAKMG